ncbi:oligosaccharide flippase family protein [Mucilaginibacter sp. Mucisp84]|uniref:oligosaccharide flippase family protein n=1 Tax=Mucilaginibacter sp. Mucisp84 TaxID=3243058 RepID=UPI0039A512F1
MSTFIKKILSNKVVKNFSYLTIGNFLSQFILVFSSIKIARILGPAGFGVFSYILIQSALYAVIAELGIRNISIRTVARDGEKSKLVFFSAIFLQLIGLGFSVILMLIYEHFAHSVSPELLLYLVINVFVLNLWSSCEAIWQGHQRMGIAESINVFFSIVWLVFIIITPSSAISVNYVIKYYTLILLGKTMVIFSVMFLVKDILKGSASGFLKFGRSMIKDSSHYYLNNIFTLPTNYLSNNFLQINSTKVELGYFNTSNRLINPIKMVINLGMSAVFPSFSNLWVTNKELLLDKLKKTFPLFIIIISFLCFSFTLVSKEVVLILFGAKFLPSVNIIQYQIWFLFIFALNWYIGNIWGATDNQRLLSKWGIANSLIATPFLFIGSKYGGLGLSISYLIAYVIFLPFLYNTFTKSLNIKLNLIREFIWAIILFSLSVFLPLNTFLWIRIILILLVASIIYVVYKSKFKTIAN